MRRFWRFFLIVAIFTALFEGYRRYRAAEKRLAPPGEYYVIENFSVISEHGISSLRPGKKLTLIEKGESTWRLTTGKKEFEIPPANLTRDLDLVDTLVAGNDKVLTDFQGFSQRTADNEKQKIADRIVELETSLSAMGETKKYLEGNLNLEQSALTNAKNKASNGFSNMDSKKSEAEIVTILSQLSALDERIGKTKASIIELKAKHSKP